MTAVNDLALPPRAEAARLKLQLRAAQRKLAENQAAVDHLTEVGPNDAVAQLQARLLPLIDERRRAHEAELEAAREAASNRIAAAEHDIGVAPPSLFVPPITWSPPSESVVVETGVDSDSDIVSWREPETDDVNDVVPAGALVAATAIGHGELDVEEAAAPIDAAGELAPPPSSFETHQSVQEIFAPPTGEDELAEAGSEWAAVTPSSWAPPVDPAFRDESAVHESAQDEDDAPTRDGPEEPDSEWAVPSDREELIRQIADLVEARLRGDAVVGDRLTVRSPSNDVRIVFDSASFGEAMGTALGATAVERSVQPVYQPAPPRKSFWANTWHADVLLSLIALIIVIVVLIAWAA